MYRQDMRKERNHIVICEHCWKSSGYRSRGMSAAKIVELCWKGPRFLYNCNKSKLEKQSGPLMIKEIQRPEIFWIKTIQAKVEDTS